MGEWLFSTANGIINSNNVSFIITVNHEPTPVNSLEAQAMESGDLKTKLVWDASADPTVNGYNIYSKEQGEPYLVFLYTASNPFYDTIHPCAENSLISTRIYAVSAVKADGTENFLSDMVRNDDRDHDGLTDEAETTFGSIIDNPDSDGDKLLDGEEYSRSTNPLLPDTDEDGYSDYDEVQGGSDPLDDSSVPLCPGDFNTDGDLDGSDLAVFAGDFGRTDCSGDCEGDFDDDVVVDGSDLAVFESDFGRTDCEVLTSECDEIHITEYWGDPEWVNKQNAEDGDWSTASSVSSANKQLYVNHPYNGDGERYWQFKYSSSGYQHTNFQCYEYDSDNWINVWAQTTSITGNTVTKSIPGGCLSVGQPIQLRVHSATTAEYYEGHVLCDP